MTEIRDSATCARCQAVIFEHGEFTWVAPTQDYPARCGPTLGIPHVPAPKPVTCPACGGERILPADYEGGRPAVMCDMCFGAGWGLLGAQSA